VHERARPGGQARDGGVPDRRDRVQGAGGDERGRALEPRAELRGVVADEVARSLGRRVRVQPPEPARGGLPRLRARGLPERDPVDRLEEQPVLAGRVVGDPGAQRGDVGAPRAEHVAVGLELAGRVEQPRGLGGAAGRAEARGREVLGDEALGVPAGADDLDLLEGEARRGPCGAPAKPAHRPPDARSAAARSSASVTAPPSAVEDRADAKTSSASARAARRWRS
jgi:hypothetical protein